LLVGERIVSFEFKQTEEVSRGARRIACGEIEDVVAALGSGAGRGVRGDRLVHETRKRLKKLRALVRVVRDSIGEREYRRGNRAFRDAGRALAAARDAKVLVDAFDKLLEHFAGHVSPESFGPLRRKLLAARREALRDHEQAQGNRQVVQALREAKRHVGKWKFNADHDNESGFTAIKDGLKRIYRQGREAYEEARHDRDFEKLHEWRKRVKDLWHATQLLEPVWPDVVKQFGDKAHGLADCLGDDHDLAELRQTIADDAESFGSAQELETLLGLIDARRRELQQSAMELGERVYGERPGAFVQRMGWYWDAWRSGQAATEPASVAVGTAATAAT
jgi:CHAD domain-containing protein